MSTKSSISNDRDALFDNIRGILIILVILCHMFSGTYGASITKQPVAVNLFYQATFFFHIPGFMVISGFFSKNPDKSRDNAVKTFLLPYLVFNLISSLLYLQQNDMPWYKLDIFYPRWGFWFLFTMFLWKLFLKDIVKLRFALPLSFAIGLFAGFFEKLDSDLALGRAFALLPLFLLGYYLKAEYIEKIRSLPKWIPCGTLILVLGFAVFVYFNYRFQWTEFFCFHYHSYKMDAGYHDYDLSFSQGLLSRAAIYLFSILSVFCLLALTPRKKIVFSTVGQNTLTVYTLHLFVLQQIKPLRLFGGYGWDYILFSIVFSILLGFLLSSKPVVKAYNFLFDQLARLLFRPEKNP